LALQNSQEGEGRMKKLMATAAALGVLTLSACKQPVTSISNNQTQGQTDEAMVENLGTANMSGAAVSVLDQTYVQNAAASDLFEIETSRLALERATSPAIKTYAQTMIDEHTKSSNELRAAAQQAAIALPAGLPADKQAKVAALGGLSGAAFDRQYLADQRTSHQETLAKVNEYLASAQAGPLKDHASKLTGVVQKHLNGLENIE
jgi:putative membrane protein